MRHIEAMDGVLGVIIGRSYGGKSLGQGIATVFCQHTSCSLVLMENAGRAVADEAEILTLAVTPLVRRNGAGRALVEAAAAIAAARGADSLFLEVAATNAAALGLYAASGFETAGLRRAYYADGADALVMRRTLNT